MTNLSRALRNSKPKVHFAWALMAEWRPLGAEGGTEQLILEIRARSGEGVGGLSGEGGEQAEEKQKSESLHQLNDKRPLESPPLVFYFIFSLGLSIYTTPAGYTSLES